MAFKDIIVNIIARLAPASAKAVSSEMQEALNQGTNPAKAVENIGKVDNAVSKLGLQVSKFYQAFIAFTIGRAIYKFFDDSIMLFAKFDQKIQQSVAIMDGVTTQMRTKMGAQAIELSKELNIAAEDLAGAYYYLASAGLTAEQSMKALPIVALFMKAGMMDAAKATELLTQANAVLGYQSVDASKNLAGMVRIADVLTAAANKSQATIEQLATALSNKAGNSLRLFGKDVEEGAAVLAVFANQGVKGAAAGERLDMFLRQAALAAIKHKEVFQQYGISIFDAHGKMRDLADIADDMTKALGHLSGEAQVNALSQLGFQVRTVAAAKAMIDQGTAIRDYEKALRSASGYTKDVAEKQLDTPIEKWGQLGKKIAAVRMEIGEHFVAALTESGKVLGDENRPDSIIGMLRMFSHWLDDNREMIGSFAKIVVWVATKPLMAFFDAMNMLADLLVINVGASLSVVSMGFTLLAGAAFLALKPLGMFLSWISGGYFHEMDDFADKLGVLTRKIADFGVTTGQAAAAAAKDFFKTGFGQNKYYPPVKTTPLIDGLSGDGSGRSTTPGTDNPDGESEKDRKAREKRANDIQALNDRLNGMLAKFTKERADDELLQLEKIERGYHKLYGDDIPEEVQASIDKIKEAIKNGNDVEFFAQQLELFKSVGVSPEMIDDLVVRMTNLRDSVDEGSTAWAAYNKLIEQAIALGRKLKDDQLKDVLKVLTEGVQRDGLDIGAIGGLQKFIEQVKKLRDAQPPNSEEWKKYNDILIQAEDVLQKHLRTIGQVGAEVAGHLSDSFSKFFTVLTSGARRGLDAFHALAKGIAVAAVGGLGEFALKKAKQDFALAAEQVALGVAAGADPLTAADAAPHFAAALQLAEVGALWGVLAGGASAGAAGLSGGGAGNAREVGASQVNGSIPKGQEINIFIDGVDPNNPRHQQLIGDTVAEYQERTGGAIVVTKGFKRP